MKGKTKSKIMLLIFILSLLLPIASGTISTYPPNTNMQQGYILGSATCSIGASQITLTMLASPLAGSHSYAVTTNTVNLTNISYISIDWSASFGATIGASYFGISNNQMDNSFVSELNYTTSRTRRVAYLDVTTYSGNYYIKVGGYTNPSLFSDYLTIRAYNIKLHNYTTSTTLSPTSVGTTSATLRTNITADMPISGTFGFWLGNNTNVNSTNYYHNISSSDFVINEDIDSYPVTETKTLSTSSLVAGKQYYIRSWTNTTTGFNSSETITNFLTYPSSPTSLSTTPLSQSIILTWTNTTLPPDTTNHSVIIHYSKSAPVGAPTPSTWGTLGANVSDSSATILGLEEDTTYYFVAWTYINHTGLHRTSTEFSVTSGTTSGGIYNITVRYENETIGAGNLPVNLSRWGVHRFTIHGETRTELITFNNGVHSSTAVSGYYANNASGNFTFEILERVKYIEFHWNSTTNTYYNCYRVQVVNSGQRNITFYIRTDLPVYGEGITKEYHFDSLSVTNPAANLVITTSYDLDELAGVSIYNISVYPMWEQVPSNKYTISNNQVTISSDVLNADTTMGRVEYYTYETVSGVASPIENTLIRYTYYFRDETHLGYFQNPGFQEAWAEIYTYNSTGVKLSIHKEYWSSEFKVYPWLIYNKKYRIGVGTDIITISLIGIPPTSSNPTPDPIIIPDTGNITYSFFDVIDIDLGWNPTGDTFWLYYQDRLLGTQSVTFRLYNNEDIEIYNDTSNQNYFNFSCPGLDYFYRYHWTITTVNSAWNYINQTVGSPTPTSVRPISDIISINDLLNKTFGLTPFVSFDDETYGQEISWPEVLIFIIGFFIMCSFGAVNAHLGMMSVGLWLIFSGAVITGIPLIFILVGVFLITMGIVFALGDKR